MRCASVQAREGMKLFKPWEERICRDGFCGPVMKNKEDRKIIKGDNEGRVPLLWSYFFVPVQPLTAAYACMKGRQRDSANGAG